MGGVCEGDWSLVNLAVSVPPKYIEAVLNNPDSVNAAMELGRLDLVSALLGMIGVGAIFAGIFAFGYVSGQSRNVAKSTAEKIAQERLTEMLNEFRENIRAMREYGERREQPSSTPDIGEVEKADSNTEFDEKGGK